MLPASSKQKGKSANSKKGKSASCSVKSSHKERASDGHVGRKAAVAMAAPGRKAEGASNSGKALESNKGKKRSRSESDDDSQEEQVAPPSPSLESNPHPPKATHTRQSQPHAHSSLPWACAGSELLPCSGAVARTVRRRLSSTYARAPDCVSA